MKVTRPNPTRTARLFHALSDETRICVLDMLASGEKCVCELQDVVGAAQSRLSFHLKVLRDAGLVNDRRSGRWNYYSLRPEAFYEMSAWLQDRTPDERALPVFSCGDGGGDCC